MLRIVLVILVLATAAFSQASRTAETVLSAMHGRYANRWYRTLTFEQESITHKADGTSSSEQWHEALASPGRLRIEFGDPQAGNGALFVDDHQYVYRNGALVSDKHRVHPLLVLGFDIYAQPLSRTIQQLRELHIDLSSLHEERWEGRATMVIGANQGDTRSPQFWIDKQRLYFVRLLQPDEKNPATTEDIRFGDYHRVSSGGWLAKHVTVHSGGKLVFEERYSNVKVNPPLAERLFDPQHFTGAQR